MYQDVLVKQTDCIQGTIVIFLESIPESDERIISMTFNLSLYLEGIEKKRLDGLESKKSRIELNK